WRLVMKRIPILVLILSACFVSVPWGQQSKCKAHSNWAEFHRYNMQRWNPCETVLNVDNAVKLQLNWKHATGGGVASSPAVVNGGVYVSADQVYALYASTGALVWSYRTGGSGSSPAVANGVVYIGSDDHNVYAVNARTGVLLWSYTTGGRVTSSPAVANGVVY